MDKTFIFGHKNPDTDSICSAMALANLRSKLGEEVEATRLGELNKETEYAFKTFNIKAPRLLEKVEPGTNVIMVDHNEFSQSVDGIENANIKMLVDHHKISNFETKEPVFMHSEPVGCTGTILYKLYNQNNVDIDKESASLMLSAIASDTLLFKSPTCTPDDIKAAKELEKIAGVNLEEYGMNLLKAGTNLDDVSEKDLINMDAKEFNIKGKKVVIAQVNTVDINDVMKRQAGIEAEINKAIKDNNLDLFLFAATDIINGNSELLALGNSVNAIEKTYKLENHRAFAEGLVSRKKQFLPLVENNL